jgi:hypothetical protein
MTAVNLSNVGAVFYLTRSDTLSNVLSNVLVNQSDSNSVVKINSIILTNETANPTNVYLRVSVTNNFRDFEFLPKYSMPASNITYVTNKFNEILLNEGESLQANTDTGVGVKIIANYEIMYSNATILPGGWTSACYVVVAGGGGAGLGGGGGGGFREGNINLDLNNRYNIVVGSGGAGSAYPGAGSNGTPSCIGALIVSFGGGGGIGDINSTKAHPGGSGGGSLYPYLGPVQGCGNFPAVTPSQGYPGGGGIGAPSQYGLYGGGGGAGEPGTTPATKVASRGGNGRTTNILGSFAVFSGGGGGGGFGTDHYVPSGAGGLGGGGCGGWPNPARAGNVNSGGGGGGADIPNPSVGSGNSGGSGTVIISYPFNVRPATNTTGCVLCSNVGSYRIYQFLSSGTLTI